MNLPSQISQDERDTIAAWRHLAAAKRVRAERYEQDTFALLYYRGLALRHSDGGTGKYETFTYVLSAAAEEWLATHQITVTFSQVLEKMGPDAVKTAKRRWSAQQSAARRHFRRFPTGNEAGRPDPTYVNEDGEYSGLALTRWYVAKFCALNHLKNC